MRELKISIILTNIISIIINISNTNYSVFKINFTKYSQKIGINCKKLAKLYTKNNELLSKNVKKYAKNKKFFLLTQMNML